MNDDPDTGPLVMTYGEAIRYMVRKRVPGGAHLANELRPWGGKTSGRRIPPSDRAQEARYSQEKDLLEWLLSGRIIAMGPRGPVSPRWWRLPQPDIWAWWRHYSPTILRTDLAACINAQKTPADKIHEVSPVIKPGQATAAGKARGIQAAATALRADPDMAFEAAAKLAKKHGCTRNQFRNGGGWKEARRLANLPERAAPGRRRKSSGQNPPENSSGQ
jgi:hypothetical protein